MEEKKIWVMTDVMEYLGCGRRSATRILNLPGCPIIRRHKKQKFYIRSDAFKAWWEGMNQ